MKAYIEERSQHARGTWPHSGPDTYVAVQIVPDGVEPLQYLNRRAAERRGIEIIYCGEGYRNRCGSGRSRLDRARMKAAMIADQVNSSHTFHRHQNFTGVVERHSYGPKTQNTPSYFE